MSIFFDEDTALKVPENESWSKGERTGFKENFSSQFTAFRRSELFTSERNNVEEEYINAVDILTSAGHSNFISPLEQEFNPFVGTGIDVSEESFFKPREELEANFWTKVAELQTTDENLKLKLTEAGLDNPENMQKTIAKKSHSAWAEFQEINERATTAGKGGGFVGVAAGAFTDPIMLATIPVSFGYSVPATFGKAALKIALMEGIIGTVAETMIQLKAQPYRKELGFEDAGLETGLKNIAMVGVASATLSPALFGVFKAFGKGIKAGKNYLSKVPVEDLQKIHKEVTDLNPKFKDDTLNEIEIPRRDISNTNTVEAKTAHRENVNSAVKSINDGQPVDLPPNRNKIIYHGTDKNFNQFDLNKTADQSIWFTDDINAIKGGTVGASGKGNIIERIIDENKVKLATAEQADKLTDDQLIAQGFDGIKFEKTAGYDDNSYRIFNTEKLEKTGEVQVESGFAKNETKLAEDIEQVKEFDVPNETAYRNQASTSEETLTAGTPLAIRNEGGATSAAKTVPTGKLAETQDLVSKSQRTDVPPSSTVLATAKIVPPLIRGSKTISVGDLSSIGHPLYHISDNLNEITSSLSKKMNVIKKELQFISTKHNGDLKTRIKKTAKIKEKLASDPNKTPQNIPDYLGARINLDTIAQAKLVFSDLNKAFKLIHKDDFLADINHRSINGSEYRAIHVQALTKDGFSFEIQIRLKELETLTDQSHAVYTKKTYQKLNLTAKELQDLLKEDNIIKNKLKNKYFEIKDKEFSRLNPTNDIDFPVVVGTRFDEATGETIPLTQTTREILEQDAKDLTMLKRLENCV